MVMVLRAQYSLIMKVAMAWYRLGEVALVLRRVDKARKIHGERVGTKRICNGVHVESDAARFLSSTRQVPDQEFGNNCGGQKKSEDAVGVFMSLVVPGDRAIPATGLVIFFGMMRVTRTGGQLSTFGYLVGRARSDTLVWPRTQWKGMARDGQRDGLTDVGLIDNVAFLQGRFI